MLLMTSCAPPGGLKSDFGTADQLPSSPQEYAKPLAQAARYTGQAKVAMGISTRFGEGDARPGRKLQRRDHPRCGH
jgi:hypothetical protein